LLFLEIGFVLSRSLRASRDVESLPYLHALASQSVALFASRGLLLGFHDAMKLGHEPSDLVVTAGRKLP
jgi:hypothetical protein